MRRSIVCSSCVLVVGVMLSVSAKTVAWYRFDEGVPGEVTTAETRLANSADDVWRHIAVSVGPTETGTEVKLYVNQTLVKTETVSGAYVTTLVGDNPDLNVGASGIDALLDEVRILAGVQGPDAFLYPPPPSGTLLLVR